MRLPLVLISLAFGLGLGLLLGGWPVGAAPGGEMWVGCVTVTPGPTNDIFSTATAAAQQTAMAGGMYPPPTASPSPILPTATRTTIPLIIPPTATNTPIPTIFWGPSPTQESLGTLPRYVVIWPIGMNVRECANRNCPLAGGLNVDAEVSILQTVIGSDGLVWGEFEPGRWGAMWETAPGGEVFLRYEG